MAHRGFVRETGIGFVGLCRSQAEERNLDFKGDISTWSIRAVQGQDRSRTSVVFDEALRAIRRRAGMTSSCTMTVNSEMARVMRWSLEELLEDMRRGYREDPSDTGNLRSLVETLVEQGHLDEAKRELVLSAQFLDNTHDDEDWLVASGVAAKAENRLTDADRHLTRALELEPRDQLARYLRLQILDQLGDKEGAEKLRAEFAAHGDPMTQMMAR
jgi:tetratricopeptide (TPR) repeat protein